MVYTIRVGLGWVRGGINTVQHTDVNVLSLTICFLATATVSLFSISYFTISIAEVSYCKAFHNCALVYSEKRKNRYKNTPYPCMGSRAHSHAHPTGMRACLPEHNFHEEQRSQGELQSWTVFHPSSYYTITTPPCLSVLIVRMRITFDLSVFGSKFDFARGPLHI